jgi:hypothetical protein
VRDEAGKPVANNPDAPFYLVLPKTAEQYYGEKMLFPKPAETNKTKTKPKE